MNRLSDWSNTELENGLAYYDEALISFNANAYASDYEAEKRLGQYVCAFDSIRDEIQERERCK